MSRRQAPRPSFPRHAGDLLTLLRLALTPAFVALVLCGEPGTVTAWLAVAVFAVIAASDFFDGRLARRAGEPRLSGRVLDHGADIFFLLSALASYVALAQAPWWVPASVAASFATYALRSWGESERPLRPSRIGHVGGVLNYVLVGVLVCNDTAALRLLPPAVLTALYLAVPVYCGAAIFERVRWRAPILPPQIAGGRRN
jgi:phosphatidylglycerophosphate synthase